MMTVDFEKLAVAYLVISTTKFNSSCDSTIKQSGIPVSTLVANDE